MKGQVEIFLKIYLNFLEGTLHAGKECTTASKGFPQGYSTRKNINDLIIAS
jgi:hypothetical protein